MFAFTPFHQNWPFAALWPSFFSRMSINPWFFSCILMIACLFLDIPRCHHGNCVASIRQPKSLSALKHHGAVAVLSSQHHSVITANRSNQEDPSLSPESRTHKPRDVYSDPHTHKLHFVCTCLAHTVNNSCLLWMKQVQPCAKCIQMIKILNQWTCWLRLNIISLNESAFYFWWGGGLAALTCAPHFRSTWIGPTCCSAAPSFTVASFCQPNSW